MRGLLYGDPGQLAASAIGVAVNVAYVGTVTVVALKVIGAVIGNRSREEDEDVGLDLAEVGVAGYAAESGHGVLARDGGVVVKAQHTGGVIPVPSE